MNDAGSATRRSKIGPRTVYFVMSYASMATNEWSACRNHPVRGVFLFRMSYLDPSAGSSPAASHTPFADAISLTPTNSERDAHS